MARVFIIIIIGLIGGLFGRALRPMIESLVVCFCLHRKDAHIKTEIYSLIDPHSECVAVLLHAAITSLSSVGWRRPKQHENAESL